MNNYSYSPSKLSTRRRGISVWSAAMAVAIGVGGLVALGPVSAQVTTGRIFGRAAADQTVVVKSVATGMQRPIEVDAAGRYVIDQLPDGMYSVMLEEGGRPILEHLNVGVTIGAGMEVDFDCAKYTCPAAPSGRVTTRSATASS